MTDKKHVKREEGEWKSYSLSMNVEEVSKSYEMAHGKKPAKIRHAGSVWLAGPVDGDS